MLDIVSFVATATCLLFTGAAIHVSLVEHPARLACPTEVAAAVWVPSHHRASKLQAVLAAVCVLASAAAWALGGGNAWLVGGGLVFLVVPYTFIVIMPTNKKLLAKDCDRSAPATRALLEHWGTLHSFRTALGLAASGIFLVLVVTRTA